LAIHIRGQLTLLNIGLILIAAVLAARYRLVLDGFEAYFTIA